MMILANENDYIPISELHKILPASMADKYKRESYQCPNSNCRSYYINQMKTDPTKPDEITKMHPTLVRWGCPECGYEWYRSPKTTKDVANKWGSTIIATSSMSHSSSNPHRK